MISDAREHLRVWLMLLSAVTWKVLAVESRGMVHVGLCSMAKPGSAPSSLDRLLGGNPPALLAVEWANSSYRNVAFRPPTR
jgi:hypothetical protein